MFRFRPVIFLPPSYPRLPLRSLVLALWAADTARAGFQFFTRCLQHSNRSNESLVDFSLRAIITPLGEVVVHRALGKKVMREHVPLAAATALVEDRVDDFTHIHSAWPTALSTLARLRNQLANDLLLLISQVAWISFFVRRRSSHTPLLRGTQSVVITGVLEKSSFRIGSQRSHVLFQEIPMC